MNIEFRLADKRTLRLLLTEINSSFVYFLITEYSEDIYPYATFQLKESVPAGGDSRCDSAAPLQTFVYHDPRLSAADTLQLREVIKNYQQVPGNIL